MKPNGSGHDNVKPAANGQGSMENRGADRDAMGGVRSESASADRKQDARGGEKSANFSQRKPYSGGPGTDKRRGNGSGGSATYSGRLSTDKRRGSGSGSSVPYSGRPGADKRYGDKASERKLSGDRSAAHGSRDAASSYRKPYSGNIDGHASGAVSNSGSSHSARPCSDASAQTKQNKSYGNSPAARTSAGDRQPQRSARDGASGSTARDVALTALRFVGRDGAYAAQALDRAFRQLAVPLSEADRRLAASIFYFTLENRLRIETCLQRRFDAQPDRQDKPVPQQRDVAVADAFPAEIAVQAASADFASPEQAASEKLAVADDGSATWLASTDAAEPLPQSESAPACMAAAGNMADMAEDEGIASSGGSPEQAAASAKEPAADAEPATETASGGAAGVSAPACMAAAGDDAVAVIPAEGVESGEHTAAEAANGLDSRDIAGTSPQGVSAPADTMPAGDRANARAPGVTPEPSASSVSAPDHPAGVSAPRRVPAEVMDILCLAAAQILYMDRIPDYAAVNEAVKQARRYASGKRDAGGTPSFVNAILRALIRDRDEGKLSLPDPRTDPVGWLSQKCSLALPLAQRLNDVYGPDEALRIASWTGDRRVETVRPNRLRMSDVEFEDWLDKQGFEWSRGIVPGAYRVANAGRLAAHSGWYDGLFSIQGESAMLAALAMEVKPGMQVLDACAAPGGKTCLMAETMSGAGRVHAWDVHEHRVELIKSAARRLGLDNVRAQLRDASKFNVNYADMMDAVLVDAPCSGLGVIGDKPDIKYRMSEGGIEALVELQRAILDTCARYVRPGGLLVYSTCTLLPEENAEQVAAFLEHHPEFEPDNGSAWLPDVLRGELHAGCLQILPSRHALDGFFIARLRRKRN